MKSDKNEQTDATKYELTKTDNAVQSIQCTITNREIVDNVSV